MRSRLAAAPLRISALTGVAAPVRRNMLLLAAGMAALYGMVELASAVATLTFVSAGGSRSLTGLAPAVFLSSAALTALPAGRSMDRFGRAPVLRAGFVAGICGCLIAAVGSSSTSLPAVIVAFALVGASIGTVMLSRTAAADMYPAERRAEGIALVLFGAVFGALLGPAVFIPLVGGGELEGSSLGAAWLGAAAFMAAGLALLTGVRTDPTAIARSMSPSTAATREAEPVARILRRPGIAAVLVGAVASWAIMVTLMTLMAPALASHHHAKTAIFPVLSAHFVGMFALFPVVGVVIDRVGGRRALLGGLILLTVSALALPAALVSVPLTAVVLLCIGLGWSFAYVSATTELLGTASPAERGRLLGACDLLSGLTGAGLVVLAGYVLDTDGVEYVAGGAALVAVTAMLLIVTRLGWSS